MKERRWQDWLNLLIGVWLFISPWAIRFAGTDMTASWNDSVKFCRNRYELR